jgi:gamma-glutamyltranspeptidase / glutathione hydrolase
VKLCGQVSVKSQLLAKYLTPTPKARQRRACSQPNCPHHPTPRLRPAFVLVFFVFVFDKSREADLRFQEPLNYEPSPRRLPATTVLKNASVSDSQPDLKLSSPQTPKLPPGDPISNRYCVRIEIAVTHSKQSTELFLPVTQDATFVHASRAILDPSKMPKTHARNLDLSPSTLKKLILLFLGAALFTMSTSAQDRTQARSMVVSQDGIVAAESPLAAQAGAMILAHGGNAVDAAVAANAVVGVVEPMMNGIGGDLFAIVYDAKTGKLYGLNASGWAPAKLSIEFLKTKGVTSMPQSGIQSVTVPGAVDGWSKLLEKFGTKQFPEILAPAIHFAREGFPLPEVVTLEWKGAEGHLKQDPNAAATFLIDGRAPHLGEVFRNPDLAHSLELVALGGRDAYYKGDIANRIVATSARLGGTMTLEDLAGYSSEWVEPISTTYRDWTVYEIPPNGQGIAALEMLNIMETFPLGHLHNSADVLHVMIESKKLAYADLQRYVADQKFSTVPVAGMLSKQYAAQRAKLIDMAKANCDVSPGEPEFSSKGDTMYLSVVDRDGNMVSLIQSNYNSFGSGIVADGTGFALHNRGALFSFDPASPNALAGRKRPLHTIIPGFMTRGQERIAFGIMGGFNQAQAHAQFVADIADFGMNIQAALEAPRFTKYTFAGCDLKMEKRFPAEVRKALEDRGHKIEVIGSFSSEVGAGQAVRRDFSTGVNYGASDPRKDGAAIPSPPALK